MIKRSDFVDRSDERKIDFLQYYRLVATVLKKENNLSIAEFEMLFYLHPLRYFIKQDFEDGTLTMNWSKTRWLYFVNKGWIITIEKGNRFKGEHYKYSISPKAKRLVNRTYRILAGVEDLPMSIKRSSIMRSKAYQNKRLAKAIKLKKENQ